MSDDQISVPKGVVSGAEKRLYQKHHEKGEPDRQRVSTQRSGSSLSEGFRQTNAQFQTRARRWDYHEKPRGEKENSDSLSEWNKIGGESAQHSPAFGLSTTITMHNNAIFMSLICLSLFLLFLLMFMYTYNNKIWVLVLRLMSLVFNWTSGLFYISGRLFSCLHLQNISRCYSTKPWW